MREHVHTGFPHFLFAGVSAIVLLHILRFLAAAMADHSPGASKAIAAFALAD